MTVMADQTPTKRRKIAERNAIADQLEKFINSKIKVEIEKGTEFPYMQFISRLYGARYRLRRADDTRYLLRY